MTIDAALSVGIGSERPFMDARWEEIREQLGAERVIDPPGSLPQPAERLDASGPVRAHELEVAVERLCLDSTSHRELRHRCDADPERMAARITEIVGERGKMHNPATDSGGILLGTVADAGERFASPPPVGSQVATLGSLTLTPLRLDAVTHLDPDSPQVEVAGTAYVFERAPVALVPDDLPPTIALELFDVCAAASQVRDLLPAQGTVCVLGAGHAGKLALASARAEMEGGTLVAIDVDAEAVSRVADLGLCDVAVTADLRDPLAALDAVRSAGVGPADLTVVVVNATDCEPTAILLTADRGTVLFFSMATRFSAAALAADGIGTAARMLIGSGYSPDRGDYALELVRESEPLRRALGLEVGDPA
jgi:L-erythro-3,5-diaminohexanoate dehydrogenase